MKSCIVERGNLLENIIKKKLVQNKINVECDLKYIGFYGIDFW